MTKKILCLTLFCALSSFAQDIALKIEVQGHRGSRGTAPENTIAAFEEALKAGVDVLEFDMNMTKDGVLVISHDRFINKDICLNADGKKIEKELPIIMLTLQEVKKFDCGTLKNPKFPEQIPSANERIPTLEEVFEFVKNSKHPAAKNVGFNIETKIVTAEKEFSASPEVFAKEVIRVVKKFGFENRVVVQSFDWRTLAEVKKIAPLIKVSQLSEGNYIDPKIMSAVSAEILSPWYKWIDKEYVVSAHKAGKRVIPWTLNDQKSWEQALELGVDGIITDYPKKLMDWLKEKKLK